MSYFCNALLCLSGAGDRLFQERLQEFERMSSYTYENLTRFVNSAKKMTCPETGAVVYQWEAERWCCGEKVTTTRCTHIAAFEYILSTFPDTVYVFIRLGETITDIEVYGEYSSNTFEPGIVRHIRVNQLDQSEKGVELPENSETPNDHRQYKCRDI